MSTIFINTFTTGLSGDVTSPQRCTLVTTDSLATITAPGYMNQFNGQGYAISTMQVFDIFYAYNKSTGAKTYGIFNVTYSVAHGYSLDIWENPGNVLLPVVDGDFANFHGTSGQIGDDGYSPSDATKTKVVMANGTVNTNHIAVYKDTSGTIGEDATTAINKGNIQAGTDGNSGKLTSYPSTAGKGNLSLAASNNLNGDYSFSITNNNDIDQSTTYYLADPGASTASFILSDYPGTQNIYSGNIDIINGDLLVGSTAGGGHVIYIYSGGPNMGGMILQSGDNANPSYFVRFQNASFGQSSTVQIPDPANANANLLIGATNTPFVSGNFPVASGTNGLMVDSGVAATNLQQKTNIKAAQTANIGGAGAGPINVSVTGLVSTSVVDVNIVSSSNPVQVQTVTPASNQFAITFSGDPGANCIISYIAFIVAQ